jgi:signal transduction histidine kinase
VVGVASIFYTSSYMLLIGTAITLSEPSGYNLQVWKQNILHTFTAIDLTLFFYGIVLGILWFVGPPAFALGLIVLGTMYWSLKSNADVRKAAIQQQQFQDALASLLTLREPTQQFTLLLDQLWHLFPIEQAGIVLFKTDTDDHDLIVAHPAIERHALYTRTELLRSLGAGYSIRRIDQEPACTSLCRLPTYLIPLLVADEMVGVLLISLRDAKFESQDFRLLATYGAQAALTVIQARLIDHLQSSQDRLVRSERLAAIGKLAANLAHEFNNILGIMSSSAEAALLRQRRDDQINALQAISTTARRGGSITRGLLTFSRQIEPRQEPIVLHDAIEPILAMLATRFRNQRIALTCELAPDLPLIGDAGLLSQAVLNLLANTLDAMPDGGTLCVRAWRDDAWLHLTIQDSGCGIPDEIRTQLFEPFNSSKPLVGHNIGGSGLGLAITFGIITSHHGTIAIDSQLDAGTTVTIRLPAASDLRADAPSTQPAQLAAPQRVIVVDDEPLIAANIADILALDGHQVAWFDDPRIALDELTAFAPDVLIADIHMPGIDGMQLLKLAKARFPQLRQVLITGQSDILHPSAQLAADIRVIRKPCTATEIYAVLGRFQPLVVPDFHLATPEPAEDTPALRDDLRHRLLNLLSSLEGMFRLSQRGHPFDPSANDRFVASLNKTICELSVFLRAQHQLGVLDGSGRRPVTTQCNFSIAKLLDEVRLWAKAGLSSKYELHIQIECSPDLTMFGDSKILLPALLAAVQNAVESMQRADLQSGTITISARQDAEQLILSVEDHGAGFDPAILSQVAQRIEQGNGEQFIGVLEPRYGTGLGIALMLRVARLHQGTLRCGNHPQKPGAWVQFILPTARRRIIEASGLLLQAATSS